MSLTYLATLRGNCLEWQEATPEDLGEEKEVAVSVTILDEPGVPSERRVQGERMAAALSELAAHAAEGLAREIRDPSAWQTETRSDRPLPGRDD